MQVCSSFFFVVMLMWTAIFPLRRFLHQPLMGLQDPRLDCTTTVT